MKPTAVIILALCAACLGAETSTTESVSSQATKKAETTTKRVEGTTKKVEATTKKTEAKVAAEGRAAARMEISDSQLEMALKDKRYLQRQLKCTLGEAPCDPVGRRLRTLAPLVVRGACPQCTQTEMRQIQKVLLHMQRNFPKEWAKVVRTYQ